MGKELYVGSISPRATETDILKLFSVSGRVTSIHLITDRDTGEFKRCGYVRMATEAEAADAIETLDGALLIDGIITVRVAREQKPKNQPGGHRAKTKPAGDTRPPRRRK